MVSVARVESGTQRRDSLSLALSHSSLLFNHTLVGSIVSCISREGSAAAGAALSFLSAKIRCHPARTPLALLSPLSSRSIRKSSAEIEERAESTSRVKILSKEVDGSGASVLFGAVRGANILNTPFFATDKIFLLQFNNTFFLLSQ